MQTQIVEVTNGPQNWGKFLIGRFDEQESSHRSAVATDLASPLIWQRGWGPNHRLVLDLETGEGVVVAPGGNARADLKKHQVWVCPMFEPFLAWWYEQWPAVDVGCFPPLVDLPDTPFEWAGYRRTREG